jgi:hypothetical protein
LPALGKRTSGSKGVFSIDLVQRKKTPWNSIGIKFKYDLGHGAFFLYMNLSFVKPAAINRTYNTIDGQ